MLGLILFAGTRKPELFERAGPWVSPRHSTACCEKEIKTRFTPKPSFFLDSFVYCILWAHHSKVPSVKILLFSYSNNLKGPGFFSRGSYIPLYIISMFQKFDCQLHVGKKQARCYCN